MSLKKEKLVNIREQKYIQMIYFLNKFDRKKINLKTKKKKSLYKCSVNNLEKRTKFAAVYNTYYTVKFS